MVLFILTIILGVIGVRLTRDQGDIVREEARRLAVLLQNARQQAILEGRPYGFVLTRDGYRFLRLDEQHRLSPVSGDALFRERVLPPAVRLQPFQPSDEEPDEDANERPGLIVFDPSGVFPAFTMRLESEGIAWYVRGRTDGQILSSPFLEPAPA